VGRRGKVAFVVLVVEAAAELTRASLELRLLSAARVVDLLGTLDGSDPDGRVGSAGVRKAEVVGHTVSRVASRLPWNASCLRQALATQRMLRRRRIASRLHLGVRNPKEAAAHAWVTVGGQPVVGGAGIHQYVPLGAFR
jgi:transglutaminase superfamily protein